MVSPDQRLPFPVARERYYVAVWYGYLEQPPCLLLSTPAIGQSFEDMCIGATSELPIRVLSNYV